MNEIHMSHGRLVMKEMYKSQHCSAHCSNIEEELKVDLFSSWFEKFTLQELYDMEEQYKLSKMHRNLFEFTINSNEDLQPEEVADYVRNLRLRLNDPTYQEKIRKEMFQNEDDKIRQLLYEYFERIGYP